MANVRPDAVFATSTTQNKQFEEDIKRNGCTSRQPDCGTFESKSRIVKSLYLLYFRPTVDKGTTR